MALPRHKKFIFSTTTDHARSITKGLEFSACYGPALSILTVLSLAGTLHKKFIFFTGYQIATKSLYFLTTKSPDIVRIEGPEKVYIFYVR
jgi:hypothetical protein